MAHGRPPERLLAAQNSTGTAQQRTCIGTAQAKHSIAGHLRVVELPIGCQVSVALQAGRAAHALDDLRLRARCAPDADLVQQAVVPLVLVHASTVAVLQI